MVGFSSQSRSQEQTEPSLARFIKNNFGPSPQQIRDELIQRLNELADWSGNNNEETASVVLYSLEIALIVGVDTLLAEHTSRFGERFVDDIKAWLIKINREIAYHKRRQEKIRRKLADRTLKRIREQHFRNSQRKNRGN